MKKVEHFILASARKEINFFIVYFFFFNVLEVLSRTTVMDTSVECKDPMGLMDWQCDIGPYFGNNSEVIKFLGDSLASLSLRHDTTSGRSSTQLPSQPPLKPYHVSELEVFYSNKVNQSDGSLFISATLRWRFQPKPQPGSDSPNFFLLIQEVSEGDGNVGQIQPTTIFLIKLNATAGNSTQMQRLEMFVRMENQFNFGGSYIIKVLTDCCVPLASSRGFPPRQPIIVNGTVKFPKLLPEANTFGCVAGNVSERLLRKEMASRWNGALDRIHFFPLHRMINVTFFGAPPSHCIEKYDVQLWLLNALVDSKTVQSSELQNTAPNVYIGHALFTDLLRDMQYKVRVAPGERAQGSGDCICEMASTSGGGKCGCVLIWSDFFTLPRLNMQVDNHNNTLLTPIPNMLHEIEQNNFSYFLLAGLLSALTLVLLSIALVLLIMRHVNRDRGYQAKRLILNRRPEAKGTKDGGGDRPLLVRKESATVLLLGATTISAKKRRELELLARLLVTCNVRVYYDRLDRDRIERNLSQWVHEALVNADKIVLFHDKGCIDAVSRNCRKPTPIDLFDSVFQALHSQILYSDPRVMHVKWADDGGGESAAAVLGRLVESVFTLDRDWRHIFTALRVSLPTKAQSYEFEEECLRPSRMIAHQLSDETVDSRLNSKNIAMDDDQLQESGVFNEESNKDTKYLENAVVETMYKNVGTDQPQAVREFDANCARSDVSADSGQDSGIVL